MTLRLTEDSKENIDKVLITISPCCLSLFELSAPVDPKHVIQNLIKEH